MQPRIIALATLVAALPLAAHAADVKLYGKVNTALYYENYSGTGNSTLSMINEGSRWGLTIREDLTDDWAVKGYLENGFGSDSGTFTNTNGGNAGTAIFDRRSILALSSKTWGEFAAGRMGTVRGTMAPYALTLAWLDPMETNYGDAGMSYMFGNDPRANNTFTYVSPRINGFKVGASYSLAFYDQEADHTSKNDRLLALGGNYEKGPFGIYAGATQLWFGHDPAATGVFDAPKAAVDRKDAQAYTLGATWQATDSLKLFLAGQYQKNWRSVAGWNADKASTHATAYTAADRAHGVDGWNGLVGLQYKLTGDLRFVGKYVYFDGEHKMENGSKVKGKRHAVNTALEYWLSKRTRAYGVLSYFKGTGELDVTGLTGVTSQLGLEHNF